MDYKSLLFKNKFHWKIYILLKQSASYLIVLLELVTVLSEYIDLFLWFIARIIVWHKSSVHYTSIMLNVFSIIIFKIMLYNLQMHASIINYALKSQLVSFICLLVICKWLCNEFSCYSICGFKAWQSQREAVMRYHKWTLLSAKRSGIQRRTKVRS